MPQFVVNILSSYRFASMIVFGLKKDFHRSRKVVYFHGYLVELGVGDLYKTKEENIDKYTLFLLYNKLQEANVRALSSSIWRDIRVYDSPSLWLPLV